MPAWLQRWRLVVVFAGNIKEKRRLHNIGRSQLERWNMRNQLNANGTIVCVVWGMILSQWACDKSRSSTLPDDSSAWGGEGWWRLSEPSPQLSDASRDSRKLPRRSRKLPRDSRKLPRDSRKFRRGLWEASPGVLGKLPRNSGKPEGRGGGGGGGWRLLELEALGGGGGGGGGAGDSFAWPPCQRRAWPGAQGVSSPPPHPPNPPGAQLPRLPRVSSTPSKPSQELSAQLPRLPQPMCAKPVRNKLFSADTALPRQLSSLSPASSHNVLCTLFYSVLLLLPRANTDLHQCPGHAPSKSLGFENARNHPGAICTYANTYIHIYIYIYINKYIYT